MTGMLLIVSAPSGAGKTSLVNALLDADPGIRKSVSYTTRAPRPGEVDGRHYHFVTPQAFDDLERAQDLLESATVHDYRYGTSRLWVIEQLEKGQDIVLEIDWQGAAQIRRLMPDAVSIFILPPSFETLVQRLNARAQDAPDVIARRLANAREELRQAAVFDYAIINDDFRTAAAELQCLVRAERLRTGRQRLRHAELFKRLT